MKIAVFISGNGSNLQALIDAEKNGNLSEGKISLVVSDNAEAYGLERAKKADIETFVLENVNFSSREQYDEVIIEQLKAEGIELVVLAGFMRILSKDFIDAYEGKILNIHPSLLPSFKGAHGIKDAFKYGVKVTGVTTHFVTEELDAGPIILQKAINVEERDTLDTIEEKIHKEEHILYPETVRLFVEGKIDIKGNKVRIKN